jgi:hypothetical protein
VLNTKLSNYFYSRDLFAFLSPLKTDAYFFGRSKTVQYLYGKYIMGEQSGLFGSRKLGKTSVLYALERQLALHGEKSIYINCEIPTIHKSNWYELLTYIIKAISEKYNLNLYLGDIENRYNENFALKSFEEDMISINKRLYGKRILIIFDEIEYICFSISNIEHWKSGKDFILFWQTIRSIYQKDSNLFAFLIAGVNPLCTEAALVGSYDNPLYGMIKPTYLELFGLNEVKEMVSGIGGYMGLKFDEELYTKLTEDYFGHPFLIGQVCSLINKDAPVDRPCNISKEEYAGKKESYDSYISCYLNVIKAETNTKNDAKTKQYVPSYKGNDPYIFISYSHKDSDAILSVISELNSLGYNIWYDEGIDPGNEWPDEIANALERCAYFIVFISNHSIASRNVLNEINFAIDEDKPFLAIHIEETKLPSGLKLRIGSTQAIMKYRIDSDIFYKKLNMVLGGRGMQRQELLSNEISKREFL